MTVSELISYLESMKNVHGDAECFANGEFGVSEPKALTKSMVDFDKASNTMEVESFDGDIEPLTVICYIGGY